MKTEIEGEVTAETILSQCMRMSNDKIWAFFEFCPHIDEIIVRVRSADENSSDFYNSFYEPNYGKSLADIMQDLIEIQYESEARCDDASRPDEVSQVQP